MRSDQLYEGYLSSDKAKNYEVLELWWDDAREPLLYTYHQILGLI